MSWSRSGTVLRRRCRNLRCTKPRGTSRGYGYLIQLVAAQLRGSKKRNVANLSGTTANWVFCKLRGLLIGDFVASKPQHRPAWAEHGRRHDGGLGSSLWVGGKHEIVLATSCRACGRDRAGEVDHRMVR